MQKSRDEAGHGASLEEVICTVALQERRAGAANHAAENLAFVRLAQQMAQSPREILQTLTDVALQLCRAGSAGISIIEGTGRAQVFRWHALSGELTSHLGETMPRDFSPCGIVVDGQAVQLMCRLERHFGYFANVRPEIVEALLVPFRVGGQVCGTVWVVIHNEHDHFDSEDARLLENLGTFTAAAYQLRTALEASREIDRRKDEFLATVVHELRNPLAAASNASQIVERRLKSLADPQLVAMHRINQRQLKSMSRMIDDLLDVARIRLDKLELRKEVVSIEEIVQGAVDSCQASMDTLTHQLIVLFPDHTLWVDADPLRLTQVVSNLLNNAVKYTPPGGRIECTVRDVDGHAVLSVSDTGVGITVEMLPRIFDLFAQADGARTRGRDGLGIGLTLVRRLVQLHGGQVEGRSDGLGRGSEFIVRLPLTQPLCEVPLNAASLPNRALATRKIGYACAPRRPFEIA